ncbi:MAG: hypothetical protein GYB36_02595 [Alphaproteobacteria bacterium]|nr:hypothetical protein [Alphaproteobacteria bacterium]
MTRISTFAANQAALADLMRAQRNVFDMQQQLVSGKKATDLKGVGHQAETLTATRAAIARSEAFQQAGIRAAARLEAQDTALNSLNDAASNLRLAATAKDGNYLMFEVENAFNEVVNALNSNHVGSYIFGGTRSDVPPVNVSDINPLIPLSSAAEVFENSERLPAMQLHNNISVDVGLLASDVATDLMAAFKAIADFNAGPNGPFVQPMTEAQETFIIAEVGNVLNAMDAVITAQGEAGAAAAQVDNLQTSHSDRQAFMEQFLSDIEDADMAETAANFQLAQTALDVSARTFATLSDVSLLPFLR